MKRPEALGAVYDIILYELLDVLLHIDFTPPGNSPTKLIGTGELWSRSTRFFPSSKRCNCCGHDSH